MSNSINTPSVNWSNTLRIGAGSSDYETNLYQIWSELNVRPAVIRQGFPADATKFWALINETFPEAAETATVSTDHVITKESQLIHISYYFLRLADGLYMTFSEFTPDYDESKEENADMIQRVVSELNIFYRPGKDARTFAENLSYEIGALKLTEFVTKSYHIVHAGLGGYKTQYSLPPDDEVDVASHFGKPFAAKYKQLLSSIVQSQGLVTFEGLLGTGEDLMLWKCAYDLSNAGQTVLVLPKFLHAELGTADLQKYLLSLNGFILVLENAEEALLYNADFLRDLCKGEGRNVVIIASVHESKPLKDTLLFKYKLGELKTGTITAKVANELAKTLELTVEFDKPVILADIYRLLPDEDDDKDEKPARKIGFNKNHL